MFFDVAPLRSRFSGLTACKETGVQEQDTGEAAHRLAPHFHEEAISVQVRLYLDYEL